ncbi:hypothetical protein LCGC14_1433070, partial [marine sediment metagenome]
HQKNWSIEWNMYSLHARSRLNSNIFEVAMKALDLFCKFEFVQGDALEYVGQKGDLGQ